MGRKPDGGKLRGEGSLQTVADGSGYALALKIFMYVESVQVAGVVHVAKSGYDTVFLRDNGVVGQKRGLPLFHIQFFWSPRVQLLGGVVPGADRVDRILEQADDGGKVL